MKTLDRHIFEMRSGGRPVLFSKIHALLTYGGVIICGFWAIPAVLLVRGLRPWRLIRFGPISASRIGTFIIEVGGICQRQSEGALDLYWFDKPISNVFWAQIVTRNFSVSAWVRPLDFWNRLLPGGDRHYLQPADLAQITTSDDRGWQEKIRARLGFLPREDAQARAWLSRQGWREGEPIICLLVRDNSYLDFTYPNTDPTQGNNGAYNPLSGYGWNHLNYRDSDIATYVPAAEWLADQGAWVFRMGKVMSKPIPSKHPRIVDYAFHSEKSDFLDIWLFAHCDLCVSTGAGIDTVSDIYCRPILFLNLLPLWISSQWALTMHLPKTLVWKATGIPLTCSEYFTTSNHAEYYECIGIRVIDLSAEEILLAVQEQWQRLHGDWVDISDDIRRHNRFWKILKEHPDFPKCHGWTEPRSRVGTVWLRSKGDDFLK
ncbi:TIGR04372 family glycosyltransferase [Methanoregula sp. UBA64]|jgi:putative glycosyltransferase (TIGR04372 family)|uniref:TIGR04372 family glycosyltransferase n=1 Tax=Methanoregula sp. UBA64 TaxID=1915554 RepID=UPI0025CC0810|nr:TIGR04372 family glycosyltransferase [Methanoregula sp. UBA64]